MINFIAAHFNTLIAYGSVLFSVYYSFRTDYFRKKNRRLKQEVKVIQDKLCEAEESLKLDEEIIQTLEQNIITPTLEHTIKRLRKSKEKDKLKAS